MQQLAFTACAWLGADVFFSGAAFSRAFHRSPALFSLTASKEFCDMYMHSARQRGSITLSSYEHLAAVFTLASERVATPARPQARGARCRVDMNKESMNPPRRRIEEGQRTVGRDTDMGCVWMPKKAAHVRGEDGRNGSKYLDPVRLVAWPAGRRGRGSY